MADGSIIIDTQLDSKGFTKGLSSLSKKAAAGIAAITAAFALASVAAIKVGMDFEAGMSKVAAISGATAEDMDILTEKAKEMGEKTKFSATEAAEAFSYMAMAGWKTEEMLGGIEGIMNLAAASGEELGLVSDIVTDALTAFGLKAKDAGQFADVLAAASSNSNTNVAMMGQTFKYAAPIAGALGYTIEDTAVAIGLMANAGIKADQAGTSLRSVMTRLAAPPKMAAKAIDKLGLSITNADGTMKPFSQVVVDLREKFAGMSEEQQVANAKALAGQEAMSGLLAVVNASQADFDKLTKAVAESAGSAERMAEIMQDNLKGQLVILGSTLEGLGIKIYDKFEKPFRVAAKSAIKDVGNLSKSMSNGQLSRSVDTIAKGFGDLVKGIANLTTKALPPLIKGFALLVENAGKIAVVLVTVKAALLAHNAVIAITAGVQTLAVGSATSLHLAISVLTGKTKLATAAQILWNAALNLNPIGLAVTAVAALAAGIGMLILTQKDEKTEMDILTESIKEQKQSWEELKQAQADALPEKLAEIDNTKRLWSELQTLIDANGQVIGDKERAKFLTNEINKVAPESIKWIDGETAAVVANNDALTRLLENKKAQIILESQEPAYKEAIVNLQEKQNEQAKISLELGEAQKKVEEARQEVEKGGGDIALRVLADKEKAATKLQAVYDENETFIRDYYKTISDYEKLSGAIMSGNYGAMDDILKNYGTSLKTATTATITELEEQARVADENARLIGEALKNQVEGVTKGMVEIAEKGAEAAHAEYEKAKKDAEKSAQNIAASFAGGVTVGGKTYVNPAMAKMVQDGLTATQTEYEKSEKDFEESGKNLAAGFAGGVRVGGKTYVNPALAKMVQDGLVATNKASDSHSPSRLFKNKAGAYIPAGFAQGILSNLVVVTSAAIHMVTATHEQTKNALAKQNIGLLGKAVVSSLAKGIQNAESLLMQTMATLGDKLMDAHLTNADKLGLLQEQTEQQKYDKLKKLGIEQINKNYLAFMAAEKEKVKIVQAEIAKLQEMTIKEQNERAKEIELKAVCKKAEEIAKLEKRLLEKKEMDLAEITTKKKKERQDQVAAIEKRYVEEKNKELIAIEIRSLEEESRIAEQFIGEYSKAFETLVTEYETANQRIMDSQTRLEEKLAAFGSLYDTIKDEDGKDTGLLKLHDIQSDIDKLDAYGDALEELKSKKPPDGFIDEVLAMDIDEALKYMELLNGQQDKDFDAYTDLWKEKQTKAKEIAQRYYKDQFENLKTNFTDKIDKQMGLLPDDAKKIGLDSAKKLAEGIRANSGLVFSAIDELITKFNAMQEAARAAQQAAAEAAGTQSSYADRSGYSVTNNDHGVQQTMIFNTPVASPSDIARANRQARRALARG